MFRSLIIAALLCITPLGPALAYTLEITEAQLQRQIENLMPLKRQQYFVTVTLSRPKIDLSVGGNRIGLSTHVSASIPGVTQGTGRATITGRIRYDNQQGAFYLDRPRLEELHIDKLPGQYQSQVRGLAQQALSDALSSKPVYRLNDQDLRQKLAKSMLKNVTIRHQTLLLELDPF
ncbi:MAG TPA: DUF1439 domain-containing protein [Gammaproteobacteria bacterium]|nr:DUF1439 domain-containing protein [Gammaproteobacteria bacterium]